MNFGKTLKRLRLEAGLTQKQLAAQLGVTKSVISFYELQERIPSPAILVKLAAVFHVSTDYLLGIDNVERLDVTGLTKDEVKLVSFMIEALRDKSLKLSYKQNWFKNSDN
ncbi:HTH-type transcriptional regulator ImmR [Eubacterium plexicaudatum ASF492]|uniref:HTH cro/C1-type domain-containing protein n=1 Tax=Eubacterium plexicaudatum ASF492 TaxID=1235802 RepID=N2AEH5_9FIRM|nr:HTH-type transcriptional regulator ImmR [Eubacterium plexicaudatum ASF492]